MKKTKLNQNKVKTLNIDLPASCKHQVHLAAHKDMLEGKISGYDIFLDQRQKLMAAKIKPYFQIL